MYNQALPMAYYYFVCNFGPGERFVCDDTSSKVSVLVSGPKIANRIPQTVVIQSSSSTLGENRASSV